MKAPIFVFGKRGQVFQDPSAWQRLQTSNRQEFDTWMWEQLQVNIQFVNHHDHAVEVYWLHGTSGKLKVTLNPGEKAKHTTMLAHEWWARDVRTDARPDSPGRWKLSDSTCLQKWKVVSDTKRQYNIPLRKCFDLSGHCGYWKQTNQCRANEEFMKEVCPLTCNHCESDRSDDDADEDESKNDDNDNGGEEEKPADNGKDEL